MADEKEIVATKVEVSRVGTMTTIGGTAIMCTVKVLAAHPEDVAQPCGRPAEYRVKHPVIVGSWTCSAHLESEIDAFFRLEAHYEGRKSNPDETLSNEPCKGAILGHNGTYSFPCVRPAGHEGACNRAFTSPEDYTPTHNCGYADRLTESDLWRYTDVPVCDHGVLHVEPKPAYVGVTDAF